MSRPLLLLTLVLAGCAGDPEPDPRREAAEAEVLATSAPAEDEEGAELAPPTGRSALDSALYHEPPRSDGDADPAPPPLDANDRHAVLRARQDYLSQEEARLAVREEGRGVERTRRADEGARLDQDHARLDAELTEQARAAEAARRQAREQRAAKKDDAVAAYKAEARRRSSAAGDPSSAAAARVADELTDEARAAADALARQARRFRGEADAARRFARTVATQRIGVPGVAADALDKARRADLAQALAEEAEDDVEAAATAARQLRED